MLSLPTQQVQRRSDIEAAEQHTVWLERGRVGVSVVSRAEGRGVSGSEMRQREGIAG